MIDPIRHFSIEVFVYHGIISIAKDRMLLLLLYFPICKLICGVDDLGRFRWKLIPDKESHAIS